MGRGPLLGSVPVSEGSTAPPHADAEGVRARALIERARRGDRDAFGELYDLFSPVCLGVAVRLLRDRREAEDLVHDVFLEAWQRVRDYDESRGSVRTWLLLRLRSRAFDRLGRAGARRIVALPEGHVASAPDVMDPTDALAVRVALAGLDPSVREAIEGTYFDGLTAREIAERVGVPIGTVKSRLARGLGALGVELSEGDIADG